MIYDYECSRCGGSELFSSKIRNLVEFLIAPVAVHYRCGLCHKRQFKLRIIRVPAATRTPHSSSGATTDR